MEDWAGLYKFARLAILGSTLIGIAIWLYRPGQERRFEEPAQRMLEDDE